MNRVWLCGMMLIAAAGCSGSAPEPETPAPDSAEAPASVKPDDASALSVSSLPESTFRPGPPAEPEPAPGQRNRPIESVDRTELDRVHDLTERFYRGDVASVFEEFSDEMKKTLGLPQLEALHKRVTEEYGEETELIAEESAINDDIRAFVRWARFDKTDEVIQVEWYLHPDDSVAGFFIEPAKRPR